MKQNSKPILGIDIGSNFVKVAIGEKNDSDYINILGLGESEQMPGSMRSGLITDISAVTDTCSQAISQAEKQADISAKQAVFGLSSHLIKTYCSLIRYTRAKPKKCINSYEMEALIEKIKETIYQKAKEEIHIELDDRADISILSSSLVSIKIDDTKVNNPIGFKGEDLEIKFYAAFAPSFLIEHIEKISSNLSLKTIAILPNTFTISRTIALSDNLPSESIIININKDLSDSLIIKNQNIICADTIDVGSEGIIIDASIWAECLSILLEKNELRCLPKKIFICGDESENLELQEKLMTSNWYKKLKTKTPPIVDYINETFLYRTKFKNSPKIISKYISSIGLVRSGFDL